MKQLLRSLVYWVTAKRIDESKLESVCISVRKNDISYFNLSSNPILSFMYRGELVYFRESPKLEKRSDYFLRATDRFFDTLHNLHISSAHFQQALRIRLSFTEAEIRDFRQYIADKAAEKAFQKALFHADQIFAECGFSIWDPPVNVKALLPRFACRDLKAELEDIAVYYFWYMRSAAARYRMLWLVRGKHYSHFAAVRSMASQAVAQELGLPHLITHTQWCLLRLEDGQEMLGVMSASAPGTRMLDSLVSPSGVLQKELTDLNVLDVICNQPDHGPNNYNIAAGEDGCCVCAFDNDNPRTFFPDFSVTRRLAGCAPMVNGAGLIARSHLSRQTADKLFSVDMQALDRRLRPYLNFLQRRALAYRIRKINEAIQNTSHRSDDFLLDASDWGQVAVEQAFSGMDGTTYLTRAVQKNS